MPVKKHPSTWVYGDPPKVRDSRWSRGIASRITNVKYHLTFRPKWHTKTISPSPYPFITKALEKAVEDCRGVIHSYELKPYLFQAVVSFSDMVSILAFVYRFFRHLRRMSPAKLNYNKLAANCYIRTLNADDDEEYRRFVYNVTRWHELREKLTERLAKDTNHNYNYITEEQARQIYPNLTSLMLGKKVRRYITVFGNIFHKAAFEVALQYRTEKEAKKRKKRESSQVELPAPEEIHHLVVGQ